MEKVKPRTPAVLAAVLLIIPHGAAVAVLFLAIQRHRDVDCPGRDTGHLREMSGMLSKENLGKKGLKFVDAYIDHACMVQASGADHVCAFVLEGDSEKTVAKAFDPFPVEVRPMVTWGRYLGASLGTVSEHHQIADPRGSCC